jgi:hypothetical protein
MINNSSCLTTQLSHLREKTIYTNNLDIFAQQEAVKGFFTAEREKFCIAHSTHSLDA